jgi:glycosyltransferase involved in cell wall biosynthesis
MEAMMFGLPIACSNVGIVTELLDEHGDIGIQVFKPGSPPGAVASAIKKASKCKINLSKYTAEAMARRWSEYLEDRK